MRKKNIFLLYLAKRKRRERRGEENFEKISLNVRFIKDSISKYLNAFYLESKKIILLCFEIIFIPFSKFIPVASIQAIKNTQRITNWLPNTTQTKLLCFVKDSNIES